MERLKTVLDTRVYRDATRLLETLVDAVVGFPRDHKHTLGARMVDLATDQLVHLSRAYHAADGAYAGYTDADGVRRIVAVDGWSSALGTLCGVAVVEGGRGLLVSMDDYKYAGFGTYVGDWGGAMTTDEAAALCDTDGRTNTLLAWAAGVAESKGMQKIRDYSYGTVCARRWFMGGLGQWMMVDRHLEAVQDALSALGGESLDDKYSGVYYSSTLSDDGYVWGYSVIYRTVNAQHISGLVNDYGCRPFAAWDYVL